MVDAFSAAYLRMKKYPAKLEKCLKCFEVLLSHEALITAPKSIQMTGDGLTEFRFETTDPPEYTSLIYRVQYLRRNRMLLNMGEE